MLRHGQIPFGLFHTVGLLLQEIQLAVELLYRGFKLLEFSVDLFVDRLLEDLYVLVVLLLDLRYTQLLRAHCRSFPHCSIFLL